MGNKGKSKHRHTQSCPKPGNALATFEKRMKAVMYKMIGKMLPIHLLTKTEREHMRMLIHHVIAARRYGNSIVSRTELKKVDKLYQQLLRTENITLGDKKLTLFELNVFSVFLHVARNVVKSDQRSKKLL